MNVGEDVATLTAAGLLTERQAEAYVLRDIEQVARKPTAEHMGVSVNVLDKHLRAARDKVEQAEATVEAVEAIRSAELPADG